MIDADLEKLGYSIDSATGFLEKKQGENEFNPKQKTAFLKAMKTHGNQSKAAHDLGFSFKIIEWHLRKDLIFNEAYKETLLEMRHLLEGELYQAGLNGKSREANLWLSAHFPETYKAGAKAANKAPKNDHLDKLYEESQNG